MTICETWLIASAIGLKETKVMRHLVMEDHGIRSITVLRRALCYTPRRLNTRNHNSSFLPWVLQHTEIESSQRLRSPNLSGSRRIPIRLGKAWHSSHANLRAAAPWSPRKGPREDHTGCQAWLTASTKDQNTRMMRYRRIMSHNHMICLGMA
jgi:hypothetical protein